MKRLIAHWIDRLTDSLMAPKTWEFQSTSWPSDSRRGGETPSPPHLSDARNRPGVTRLPRSTSP